MYAITFCYIDDNFYVTVVVFLPWQNQILQKNYISALTVGNQI